MKTVLSAAALSLMACSLAWAVPNTSPNPQLGASTTDLVKIDNRDRDHGKRHSRDHMTTTGEATVTIGVVRRMTTIGGATTAIAIPIVRTIGTTVAASMSAPFGTVHRQAVHRPA